MNISKYSNTWNCPHCVKLRSRIYKIILCHVKKKRQVFEKGGVPLSYYFQVLLQAHG